MAFLISGIAEQLSQPGGLWEWLILKVFAFISSYGWRILLFTVLLKLLLFPLDLFQRVKMRKNQRISERIKPQLEKLQQQYAGNKQALAQKQMELNKREGFSYFSSCLPMIVTLVIFFYLFSGLNNISQYMNLKQYAELYDEYTTVQQEQREANGYDALISQEPAMPVDANAPIRPVRDDYETDEAYNAALKTYEDAFAQYQQTDEYQTYINSQVYKNYLTEYGDWNNRVSALNASIMTASQEAVVAYYESESQESFLWIKNIWSPDVPWTKPINEDSKFRTNIGNYTDYGKVVKKLDATFSESEYNEFLGQYNDVTRLLRSSDNNRVNGFLILPILSVGLSFLSQFITSRLQKKSGQEVAGGGMAGSMKMMMFIMPLMMGFFALSYTSAFTLYIVVNSGMTILINLITTFAMNMTDKKQNKTKTTSVQKYGRPDPKDL